tara:strand:+ start:6423 stop:7115 length:693 start_codon:yes stop_codon:yes gene_type:complete
MRSLSVFKNVVTFFVLAIGSAQAAIIQSSGNNFNDLGTSTIDLNAGLEWLDINNTARSHCDWIADSGNNPFTSISNHGCFNNTVSDGLDLIEDDIWRLATRSEFTVLLQNWFGTSNQLLPALIATNFINLFTATPSLVAAGNWRPNYNNFSSGLGLFNVQAIGGSVTDTNGRTSLNNLVFNGGVNDINDLGTLFVRNNNGIQPNAVPTPGSLALMALGFLCMTNFRKRAA